MIILMARQNAFEPTFPSSHQNFKATTYLPTYVYTHSLDDEQCLCAQSIMHIDKSHFEVFQ